MFFFLMYNCRIISVSFTISLTSFTGCISLPSFLRSKKGEVVFSPSFFRWLIHEEHFSTFISCLWVYPAIYVSVLVEKSDSTWILLFTMISVISSTSRSKWLIILVVCNDKFKLFGTESVRQFPFFVLLTAPKRSFL